MRLSWYEKHATSIPQHVEGRPIVYVFDSSGGKLPADIQKVFDNEKAMGLNVTVQYWLDPNPS